jgi:hypothetical protein
MTLLRNDEIQAALLAYIRTKATILAEITTTEMKEDQWQGTTFTYPAIRIQLHPTIPSKSDPCSSHDVSVSFLVFTEDASSQKADKIAGIINQALHGRAFSSNNIAFTLWTTNLIPAIRSDKTTWRSEVMMNGKAN